ncbi:protease inhibitor I42 family protein [Streptomyces sp. NPDC048483]|uniref:protease inhibitor I42 family protein n=1 Tax=Streptomyces sp. NPDC048483 TaxID=3154927 RepID=UPI00342D06C3
MIRKIAYSVAVVCALELAVGCGAAPQSSHPPDPAQSRASTVFTGDQRSITVRAQEDFSIAVPYNASVGEERKLLSPRPDPEVVGSRGTGYKPDNPDPDIVGGGGTLYFRFHAQGPGTTKILLYHCDLQTCPGRAPRAPKHRPKPERITYTVTVKRP